MPSKTIPRKRLQYLTPKFRKKLNTTLMAPVNNYFFGWLSTTSNYSPFKYVGYDEWINFVNFNRNIVLILL